ncbi:MAG: cryptochrome/photolyase family protein [Crocinitomicaceae bacterium]
MKNIQLVFPHQLFENLSQLDDQAEVFLIEEWLFFKQYPFHKQKIVFHRATMKAYERYLKESGFKVMYVESIEERSDIRKLIDSLEGVNTVTFYDPVDYWLEKRIASSLKRNSIEGNRLTDIPNFINKREELQGFFRPDKKKFFQTTFYINERKRLGILLENGDSPEGGKWSFDHENRKKYPRKKEAPEVFFPEISTHYKEAIDYTTSHFSDHLGEISTSFIYPTTFEESKDWFQQFLNVRFDEFGIYEDAIVKEEVILNHSLLSPLINCGLLTPEKVIDELLSYAKKNNIPLNSLEGIVRQIIGWREFIRGMYQVKGTEMRNRNYWKFERKIPRSFYTGETGITPVDMTIKKVLQTGYCHHIERLMILGNFMLLCEFDPDEVYQWFMELFIDSYDWVMVPNVYAMSQFADGGNMTTKPYISGSNYVKKMSDYSKGDWEGTWDALFWRFMSTHRDFFEGNPRLGMLLRTYDKKSSEQRAQIHDVSEKFFAKLDAELL